MSDEPLHLAPNVPALVVRFLRAQEEIEELCEGRVGTVVPSAPLLPLVRVVQYSQRRSTRDRADWLSASELQIDVWAEDKETAWRLAETTRASLLQRFSGAYEYEDGLAGVVTHVETNGMRDLPDASYSPARPRWIMTVTVWAHPLPGASE